MQIPFFNVRMLCMLIIDLHVVNFNFKPTVKTLHSDIQNQLAEAQSTVFDAELYSKVCK